MSNYYLSKRKNISKSVITSEKKNAQDLIFQHVFMSTWHPGESLPKTKKKYKPLFCAQNSIEGPTPHAHCEISDMAIRQLQIWSLVRQITL